MIKLLTAILICIIVTAIEIIIILLLSLISFIFWCDVITIYFEAFPNTAILPMTSHLLNELDK